MWENINFICVKTLSSTKHFIEYFFQIDLLLSSYSDLIFKKFVYYYQVGILIMLQEQRSCPCFAVALLNHGPVV